MENDSSRNNLPSFSRRGAGENSEINKETQMSEERREKKKMVASLFDLNAEEPEKIKKPESPKHAEEPKHETRPRRSEDFVLEPVDDEEGALTLSALVAKRLEANGKKKEAERKRAGIISEIASRREASGNSSKENTKSKRTFTNPFAEQKKPAEKKTVTFKRASSQDDDTPRAARPSVQREEEPRRERFASESTFERRPERNHESEPERDFERGLRKTRPTYDFDDEVPVFRSRERRMYEEEQENTAPVYRESRTTRKSRTKGEPKKKSVGKYLGRFGAVLGGLVGVILIFLVGVLIIVNRGPSIAFRDQFVMTVSESSAGSILSTLFLPSETIDKIREENAIKTDDIISNGDDVVITTPAPDQEPLVLEDVQGKTFNGKMLIVADPARVVIGVPPKGYGNDKEGMKTIDMASYYNAIAAINGGGFYDTGKGNGGVPTGRQNSSGIVIHEGKMLWGDRGTTYEVIGINKDKKLVLGKMTGGQALDSGIQEALNFGPYLIVDGEPQAIGSAMTEGGLNPRSAIGQRKDGAILLLVINGRQPNSLGASYDDLISVMLEYGAVNAANLDGGSSTYMVWENEIITTCASLYGPRRMATSILVKR